MPATAVRRVGPTDWRAVRGLRLSARQTDAFSFGSTYEREAAFTEDAWREWAREDAAGDGTATFLARRAEHPVGMVAAYRDEHDEYLFHVIAMWVAPEARKASAARFSLVSRSGSARPA